MNTELHLVPPAADSAPTITASDRLAAEILAMIATAEEDGVLQRTARFDVDQARERLQFNAAFRPIADRLACLLASLNSTMERRKADVVVAALRACAVAKGMARDPSSAEPVGRLEVLRRDLGRKRPHAEDADAR